MENPIEDMVLSRMWGGGFEEGKAGGERNAGTWRQIVHRGCTGNAERAVVSFGWLGSEFVERTKRECAVRIPEEKR